MSTTPVPPIRLRLHGRATVAREGGEPIGLEPKDALLLAYVAHEGPTLRALLAAMLWPDVDEERARANLRQRLFRLRKELGFDVLEGAAVASLRDGVHVEFLDPEGEAGELLPGVSAADAAGFAPWLDRMREHRRAERVERLADIASRQESAGQVAQALTTAQQLVEFDSTSEHAHRRVMRLHYLRGDRAAALAAFDRCCDVLEAQLGVAPEPETEALRARIAALVPHVAAKGVPQPLPVTVLRPPRLIGRSAELGSLQEAWQSGRLSTVVGEAGLGKTRLLDAFVDTQTDVVRIAARPGDAGVPFTTLARLLRAVLQSSATAAAAPVLPAVRHEIARVLPEWGDGRSRDVDGQRFVLQRAVQATLVSVPELQGLVIDDLHFADAATLEMLQALIDGMDVGGTCPDRPLRWLLAFRPAEAGTPLRSFHDALLDVAVPVRVALEPLDESQVAQFVDSLALPDVRGADLAAHLLRRAGGNPLFMLETLKQAWSDGGLPALAAGSSSARPQTVQQLIERRLSQLSPAALTLARVAAVAASDFSIELAEQVLGQPAIQLASAWSELESAQVLRDGGFAHDLVYETTLASIPREIARHTHAAVARWLADHGGEPARMAAHLIGAGEDAAAIAPLRDAARRSTERTCLAEARAFLEQAAQLCAATQGDTGEFAVLFDLHHNYIANDPGAAHERLVDRLLMLAGTETERLNAAWARHNLRRFRQSTSPLAELEADVARAEKLGDERVLIALHTMLVSGYLVLDQRDEAITALQRHQALYERSTRHNELADFVGHLGDLLGEQDRFDEALRHLARAAELYAQAEEPAEVMVMMCNQTLNLRQQGRIVAAQQMFERIDRWHAANAPNPRAWLVSRASASEVLRELGRFDEALKTLDLPPDELRLQLGRLYPAFPIARAKLWLALGQHARAQQAVVDIGDDLSAMPDWLQARCRLVAARVAARVRGGGECDRPGADEWRLLDDALRLAPRDHRRSTWVECELQRAAWLEPATGAALAESIDIVASHHGMIGHAQQARLLAAGQHLASGHTGSALDWVRAAQRASSHRFADKATTEAIHPGGGSEGERDLIVARVLLSRGEAGAQLGLTDACSRLTMVRESHVPPEFRAGFIDRNPVHRELMGVVRAGLA